MISVDTVNLLFIPWEPSEHNQVMSTLRSFIEECGFINTQSYN